MQEDQELTQVIGIIYDAALDPALWADALAKIADYVGGQAGVLASKGSAKKFISADCCAGLSPQYMQLHAETYAEFDPLARVPLCDVERIVSIPELVSFDDYRRGRFYQEWAGPQGWGDVASAVIEKSGTGCTFLGIVRSEANGMVDEEMRRRMARVVPHVRRAVLIRKTMDRKQTEVTAFADILDGLSAGLFLLGANGRIVHVNAAGQRIIGANDVLRSIGGRLVACNSQDNRTLREAFAAASGGQTEIGNRGIALPLTAENGECHIAYVLPLTSGARHIANAPAATAAVFVRRAAMEPPSSPEIIRRAYNLTPTELRVLLAIVDVGGIPEVAAAFGVANSTIKTHVGRLYEKTGVGRQADLVKLVAGFSDLLAA
jgi:DNA-binding CsgD family transcriptional regulator/PAS domain-containing protein